jgi:hypothetical protein
MLLKAVICLFLLIAVVATQVAFAVAECTAPPPPVDPPEFAPLATSNTERASQSPSSAQIRRPLKKKAYERRIARRHRRAVLLERVLPTSR